ncbi:MAG TPA: lipase maturation factor family protein [Gemmatimonadales bacterium]|nr:lipase maturation factor family protein [Gemmatimonadales bacterium]
MDITAAVATGAPERPTYLLGRWLFLRLLGLMYLIAFVSLAVQITGLVGAHGVLPAQRFLERAHALYGGEAYHLFPTLCWLGAGDAMLRALCWGGALVALLVVGGVAQAPALALLWFLYLSASVVGQTFLWFQWDALLLEAGLLAVLYAPTGLGPSLARERAPSDAMRWLVWWLLFRLMFLSGITKFASGDPAWRTLTALDYHFWTQPLPTWTAWYAQWWPGWTHRGMLLLIFAIELVVPWLILVPERLVRVRRTAAALLALGQLGIAVTGNYGFFNALTLVLCVPLLDDRALGRVLPLRLEAGAPEPFWKRRTIQVFVPVIALLSTLAFAREIVQTIPGSRGALDNPLLEVVAPFRSINGYGLFRVMTTERPEIVIEGSPDTVVWHAYEFRWKPGDVTRRPRFVAPHQPRLDWQMWFAALDPDGAREWLGSLVEHLLRGTPEVLALLGENPFPAGPPRYVRLVYYHYRFATPAERARTGAWWQRDFAGYLTPALSLPGRPAPR